MRDKRYHIILATTLFAILLWASVNLTYEYQTTVKAPLVVEGIPANRAVATPFPQSLAMRFRGNGWRIAALSMSGDLRCRLDYETLPPHRKALTLNDIVERLNLPLGIQPIDMKPESLFLALEPYTEKRVPVTLERAISFQEGFGQVGPTTISPESITVGGASSVVSRIRSWATAQTAFLKLKAPVDTDVPLADTASYLLTFSPASVRVRFNIQPFAEKTIPGLPVEIRSTPTSREVILIPPKIEIVVRGGIEQLADLSPGEFRAYGNYSSIVSDTTGYLEVEVTTPPDIQLVSKRPERLQYIVRTKL